MSGTPGKTSFFSFGADDSYITKSFGGLKHYKLPSTLRDLVLGSAVKEIHWANLGTTTDSWILSFKDSSNTSSIRWGSGIPSRLQTILTKTWHSPHLRAFLGPNDSFIIWHPDLIRWGNLPVNLEDALQSWLTPSGWRVGPPRIITWGPEGAFFAMSEYGDVVYRLGNGSSWEIYKETIEEWKAEKGFSWTDLSFITLDPTMTDQFIAIRKDGTWAGSIEDVHEDALETFAINFFARAKPKSKSKPSTNQGNGQIPNGTSSSTATKPDAAAQALYEKWSKETTANFAAAIATTAGPKAKAPRKLQVRSPSQNQDSSPSPQPHVRAGSMKLLSSFPYLPAAITTCALTACIILKADLDSIHACQHDVERLLRASGMYSYEWLRQERLRWHPDRFGRLCEERWRETGKKMAGEMFKLMSVLMEQLRATEGSDEGSAS